MNALSKDIHIESSQLTLPGFPAGPVLDRESAAMYARYVELKTGWQLITGDIKRVIASIADGLRFLAERDAARRVAREIETLSNYERGDIGLPRTSYDPRLHAGTMIGG